MLSEFLRAATTVGESVFHQNEIRRTSCFDAESLSSIENMEELPAVL
jgi:hypothetical protein